MPAAEIASLEAFGQPTIGPVVEPPPVEDSLVLVASIASLETFGLPRIRAKKNYHALVDRVKQKLLTSQINGKTYAARLQSGTPAKVWDEAWVLLDEIADDAS